MSATIRPARLRGFAAFGALAAVLAFVAALLVLAPSASAAPTVTLVYSTDSGTTWSNAPTTSPGGTFLARIFYNNDTTGAIGGSQITTMLPAGFTLVAGSTRVCLNPSDNKPHQSG
jgi:hypothetical protein